MEKKTLPMGKANDMHTSIDIGSFSFEVLPQEGLAGIVHVNIGTNSEIWIASTENFVVVLTLTTGLNRCTE